MLDETADPFKSRPWRDPKIVPPAEAEVPTMLSAEECDLLYWITRDYATGAGAICDLGCFAGGSTARMAAGAAKTGAAVHAFDHFRISEDLKPRYLYAAGIPEFDGEDMFPAVRQLLSPWADRITFHKGDLNQAVWPDEPIEVLFIDAAKTPASTDAIAQTFFPHLIPGRSIVIQQDYLHWRQPWVASQMELFADRFELVGWAEEGSAVFRATSEIRRGDVSRRRVRGRNDAQLRRDVLRALARFPDEAQQGQIARMAMALEDNPGVRRPFAFNKEGFTDHRVKTMIAEAIERRKARGPLKAIRALWRGS